MDIQVVAKRIIMEGFSFCIMAFCIANAWLALFDKELVTEKYMEIY